MSDDKKDDDDQPKKPRGMFSRPAGKKYQEISKGQEYEELSAAKAKIGDAMIKAWNECTREFETIQNSDKPHVLTFAALSGQICGAVVASCIVQYRIAGFEFPPDLSEKDLINDTLETLRMNIVQAVRYSLNDEKNCTLLTEGIAQKMEERLLETVDEKDLDPDFNILNMLTPKGNA